MDVAERLSLSDEQIAEFREIYAVFDKDSDGYIKKPELGAVMRALGQNPSEAEIQDFATEYEGVGDHKGTIHFPDFLAIMSRSMENVDTMEEMLEAFRVFDAESKGTVTADELRHVMTTRGEKLTSSEIDEMLRTASMDSDGNINYEEFVQFLMAKQY